MSAACCRTKTPPSTPLRRRVLTSPALPNTTERHVILIGSPRLVTRNRNFAISQRVDSKPMDSSPTAFKGVHNQENVPPRDCRPDSTLFEMLKVPAEERKVLEELNMEELDSETDGYIILNDHKSGNHVQYSPRKIQQSAVAKKYEILGRTVTLHPAKRLACARDVSNPFLENEQNGYVQRQISPAIVRSEQSECMPRMTIDPRAIWEDPDAVCYGPEAVLCQQPQQQHQQHQISNGNENSHLESNVFDSPFLRRLREAAINKLEDETQLSTMHTPVSMKTTEVQTPEAVRCIFWHDNE